jgi:hypothetical protein
LKKSIIILVLWLVIASIAAGLFVLPTPPGGVMWPYHIVVASIPLAAFLCARYTGRLFPIVCFGLIAGYLAAWPYFTDGRTQLRIKRGVITAKSINLKIGAFTMLMPVLCVGAFAGGRRLFRRDDIRGF